MILHDLSGIILSLKVEAWNNDFIGTLCQADRPL